MGGCVYAQTKIMDVVNPQAVQFQHEINRKSNLGHSNPPSENAVAMMIRSNKESPKKHFEEFKQSSNKANNNYSAQFQGKQNSSKAFSEVIKELIQRSKRGLLKLQDQPRVHSQQMLETEPIDSQQRIKNSQNQRLQKKVTLQGKAE